MALIVKYFGHLLTQNKSPKLIPDQIKKPKYKQTPRAVTKPLPYWKQWRLMWIGMNPYIIGKIDNYKS